MPYSCPSRGSGGGAMRFLRSQLRFYQRIGHGKQLRFVHGPNPTLRDIATPVDIQAILTLHKFFPYFQKVAQHMVT